MEDAKMACRTAFGQVAKTALNFAAANTPDGVKKRFLLSAAEFFTILNEIAPPPDFDSQQTPKRLRDAEFIRVAECCAMYGKEEWSRRPRIFIVLYMMGCHEAVEEFAKEGYSDFALPFTPANLPKAIKGEKARSRFLDLQGYVLTKYAQHLEKEGEPHQNVEGSADGYFIPVEELGQGGFGQVDHVKGRLRGESFARKRIPRGRSFKRDQLAIKSFQNELTALKRLSHKHLVKLVSSYTDRNWVGLIMTPVAECNFEQFLSTDNITQIDRQTCVRRFFGCLATAVDYLHQNLIRHKDIKPANILVKDRNVLLTDFGTSHNWSEDTRSTSNGTIIGFTKRYCAPEVAGCASRNQSSDVWSLGCVFLEMGTVLHNRKVSDMRSYFENHGTRGPWVRGNKEACVMWLEELAKGSTCVDDMQPLHLSLAMCDEDPNERPTAAVVVSEILDFKGEPPYCGHCCDSENATLMPTDNDQTERGYLLEQNAADNSFQSLRVREPPHNILSTLVQVSSKTEALPIPRDLTEPISDPPSALVEMNSDKQDILPLQQDIQSDRNPSSLLMQTFSDGKGELPAPSDLIEPISNLSPTVMPPSFDKESRLFLQPSFTEPTCSPSPVLMQESTDKKDKLSIPRDIPSDRERNPIVSKSNWQPPTVEDYEGTMTLFYPKSLLDDDSDSEQDGDKNQTGLKTSGQVVHETLLFDCKWPGCYETSNSKVMFTFDSREELSQHYRSQHSVHEFGCHQIINNRESATTHKSLLTQADPDVCLAFVLKNFPLPAVTGESIPTQLGQPAESVQKNSSPGLKGQATRSKSPKDSGRRVRFGPLPDSKQPGTKISSRKVEDVLPGYDFITPDLLQEPVLPTNSGTKEENEKSRAPAGLKTPKSSIVPSYFLASSNRFTPQEIATFTPPDRLFGLVPPPLFVYGSLMFPSILRARAEQFTGAEGIYSEKHQRRLRTNAFDWSRINFSIQHAAEKMTPARLWGYDRFKPYGVTNAAIAKGETTSSVQGFVLFGLSEEALKCLDHLFSGEELEQLYGDPNFEKAGGRTSFIRRSVEVVISVKGGDTMTVNAVTYDTPSNRYRLDEGWDINKFVRSRTFTKLSGAGQGSYWMEEETRLASTIGMTLMLSGDMLCSAVLQKDYDKLLELLDNGHDVNAPCTYHGSTLAAAAVTGQEDLVELLIRFGANANATGGEYHTPLIAATTQGHEECVRSLIKGGADVLAHGGKYISALYQAVDFGDAQLAEILLEKGAWLTKEYRELLDLSAERGNRIIMRMIEDYDVRQLYLLPGPESKLSRHSNSRSTKRIEEGSDGGSEGSQDDSDEVTRRRSRDKLEKRREPPTPLAVVRSVGLQALYLKGQRGKWTGIKGVKVLRAAFDVGIPEGILDTIRPHLATYQRLVDFLGKALVEYEEEQGAGGPSLRTLLSGSKDDLLPISTSQVERQPPAGRSRKNQESSEVSNSPQEGRVRFVGDDSADDIFCLTCDGYGGRRGTGRKCADCRGAGTLPTRNGNRVTKCKSCNGSRRIFSNRDRCRACNGINPAGIGEQSIHRESTIVDDPPPPYSSMAPLPATARCR